MNEKYPLALSEGSVLAGQYIIEGVLGQGGFGITYVATDYKSGSKVAIKEFFPDTMATRDGTTVMSFTGERAEGFEYGKNCFLQEAQTLAQFIDIKNIVRIFTYFEENSTAYFVMEYVEGESFDEYIKKRGGKISFDEASKLLIPVMDALAAVHDKGIVHRDVTPDNIFICNDGTVKLLDFGAARYSIGDKSKSLDVVLKHGFAPKEQYTRHGRQGAFTDVYSLGATFYYAITGKKLPDSIDRLEDDDMIPPSNLGVDIPEDKEEVLFKAISVQPQDRFQNMREFSAALKGETALKDEAALNGEAVREIGKTVAVNAGASFGAPANAMQNPQNPQTGSVAEPTGQTKKESPLKKGFVLPSIIVGGCLIIAAVIIGIVVSTNKPRTNADLEQPTTVEKTEKEENQSQGSGTQAPGNTGEDAPSDGEDASKEGGEDTSKDDGSATTDKLNSSIMENIGYFSPVAISNINNGGIVAESEAGTFVSVRGKGLCLYTCDSNGNGNYEVLVSEDGDDYLSNINVIGDKILYTKEYVPYMVNIDGSDNGRCALFQEDLLIEKLYANEKGCFILERQEDVTSFSTDLYYLDWESGIESAHFPALFDTDLAIWEKEMFFISSDQQLVRVNYAEEKGYYVSNNPREKRIIHISQTENGENEMIMYTSWNEEDDQSECYHTNYYWHADDYSDSFRLEGYSYEDALEDGFSGNVTTYYKGNYYFTSVDMHFEDKEAQVPRVKMFTSKWPDKTNGEKTPSELYLTINGPISGDNIDGFGVSEKYGKFFCRQVNNQFRTQTVVGDMDNPTDSYEVYM